MSRDSLTNILVRHGHPIAQVMALVPKAPESEESGGHIISGGAYLSSDSGFVVEDADSE